MKGKLNYVNYSIFLVQSLGQKQYTFNFLLFPIAVFSPIGRKMMGGKACNISIFF